MSSLPYWCVRARQERRSAASTCGPAPSGCHRQAGCPDPRPAAGLHRAGSPAEIVAACAADPPSELALSAERGFHADAAIRISASHVGVRLTVDGEPGWANAAAAGLDHAVRSRAPRWAPLRRWAVGFAAGLSLVAALAVLAGRLAEMERSVFPVPAGIAVGAVIGVLMFAALWTVPIALLRVLPALELVPPGGPSPGARRARQVAAGYLVALASLVALAVAL